MLLNTHSYYSLKYGTVSPKDILKLAEHLGHTHIALTDINSTSACLDALRLAPKYNIVASVGVDFRRSAEQLFVAIAKNNQGFLEINSLLSPYLHAKEALPDFPIPLSDWQDATRDKTAPRPANPLPNCHIIYPWSKAKVWTEAQWITLQENEYVGIHSEDVIGFQLFWNSEREEVEDEGEDEVEGEGEGDEGEDVDEGKGDEVEGEGDEGDEGEVEVEGEVEGEGEGDEDEDEGDEVEGNEDVDKLNTQNSTLKTPNSKLSTQNATLLTKIVCLQTTTFRGKKDFNAHRLLRAIDNNTLLSKLEKTEEGRPADLWLSREDLELAFAAVPWVLENTKGLLTENTTHFTFGEGIESQNIKNYTGNSDLDYRLLEWLTYAGMAYRYPTPTKEIWARVHKELEIIKDKGFVSYFLISWKILKYARSKNYFYIGRGSGANSVVAYLMRITDVDPIELDLYFERFINLYRKNPPDFDIDFSWTDREDVTQYIFRRFKNASLLATYSTFQYRAVVRELGKVFGLPKHEIDRLSAGKFDASRLDQTNQLVLKYSAHIQGFPSHLSIHAGGILMSEQPTHYFTATNLPPKGYPTTHFDMVVAEDVGLHKFDILSQRGLGKIRDTIDVVAYNRPDLPAIDIHDIKAFKEDENIKDMLRNARAIGCFYVESPAMRMLLKKLRVDDYLGLVAASSVIRPGVAKSGMMREYIQRFRFPERRKDAHPVMLDIMPDTFGVMVYQEDVIKVAHYFADLTLGEADVLRRGMSGKFRSREEFQKVQEKFFSNCREKGYTDELTKEIWRQVESFAGYAFAKGHSASYAVESYQSLFLKCYFPLEYMVATLNNFGGFYRTELYVHEARMHGAEIKPPCVNHATAATMIYGETIYLGFGLVKDLEGKIIADFVQERIENGPYLDIEHFVKRAPVSLDQLVILIRIGAFNFTGKNKKELMWDAHFLLGHTKKSAPKQTLFEPELVTYELPPLGMEPYEDAFDQLELLGFALCNPFELGIEETAPPQAAEPEIKYTNEPNIKIIPKELEKPNIQINATDAVAARDLPLLAGKTVTVKGYLITIKNTSTARGDRMYFGTFIDRAGEWIDTVHFPPIATQFPFEGRGLYTITGVVMEEFDCISIEVSAMYRIHMMPDPRYADSRTAELMRRKYEEQKRDRNAVHPGQSTKIPPSVLATKGSRSRSEFGSAELSQRPSVGRIRRKGEELE